MVLPITAVDIKWRKTGNVKVLQQRIHHFFPFSIMFNTTWASFFILSPHKF